MPKTIFFFPTFASLKIAFIVISFRYSSTECCTALRPYKSDFLFHLGLHQLAPKEDHAQHNQENAKDWQLEREVQGET